MKFTYYTIIGRDLQLLKSHMQNVREYAGFDRLDCEKDLLVIVYKNSSIKPETTKSILDYCNDTGIKTFLFEESDGSKFIDNLYACWNLGYEKSDEGLVFRGGSDQVFSKDSFLKLYEMSKKVNGKKIILQANTIENQEMINKIGAVSRHFVLNLGNTFEDFDYKKFERVVEKINEGVKEELLTDEQCQDYWAKPTKLYTSLGNISRVDGCSWLMTREEWKKYGPLPAIKDGFTGDVLIHDWMQNDGYQELMVRDCVTYHFVRGESKDKY